MLKVKLKLKVEASSPELARALYLALKPDNVALPEGLQLDMGLKGRFLKINVEASDRLDSLITTIDEILEHTQLSLETVERTV